MRECLSAQVFGRITLSGMLCVFTFLSRTSMSAEAADFYFPPPGATAEWAHIDPVEAGFDRMKLENVLEFARQQRSSSLVMVYRGRVLAEGNWNPNELTTGRAAKGNTKKVRGYDDRMIGRDVAGRAIEDVASAQKSISSILCGIAQEKRLLDINDPVLKYLGPGWSKASPEQETAITVRHLLTMTTGLDESLAYKVAPGTRWFYNSTAYSRVLMCTAAAAKLDRNVLTKEWLTGPIGMQDSRWEERVLPEGIELPEGFERKNTVGFATTARDLARFGLLISAGGDWNGQVIIRDKQYLHDATHPSQKLNPSYGYLWWLNGQPKIVRGRQLIDGPLLATAPADLIAALGGFQRKLYVVPSQELVVSRLGDSCPPPDAELWRLITAARVAD